jgi:hypothetical protein
MHAEPDTVASRQRAWLRTVLEKTGLPPTALAISIGRSPSTFTRFLNERGRTLHAKTIDLIVAKYPVDPPPGHIAPAPPPPIAPAGADDVTQLAPESVTDPVIAAALTAAMETRQLTVWQVRSRAMDRENYLPGDLLIVDEHTRPLVGQVVIASDRGKPACLLRIFESPYLLASSSDPAFRRVLVVNDEDIAVRGVVGPLLRPARR